MESEQHEGSAGSRLRTRHLAMLERLPRETTPQTVKAAQPGFGRDRTTVPHRAITPDLLEHSASLRGVKFDLHSVSNSSSALMRSMAFSTRAAIKERERAVAERAVAELQPYKLQREPAQRPLTGGRDTGQGAEGLTMPACPASDAGEWNRKYPGERPGEQAGLPSHRNASLSGLRLRTSQPMMYRQGGAGVRSVTRCGL